MTKAELVRRLAEAHPYLTQRKHEEIVDAFFGKIADAPADGDRVELRGFGAFTVHRREARVARNPRTGESVQVVEKHVPYFRTGKLILARLNSGKAPP